MMPKVAASWGRIDCARRATSIVSRLAHRWGPPPHDAEHARRVEVPRRVRERCLEDLLGAKGQRRPTGNARLTDQRVGQHCRDPRVGWIVLEAPLKIVDRPLERLT
jgi:hypothetical protein